MLGIHYAKQQQNSLSNDDNTLVNLVYLIIIDSVDDDSDVESWSSDDETGSDDKTAVIAEFRESIPSSVGIAGLGNWEKHTKVSITFLNFFRVSDKVVFISTKNTNSLTKSN